MSKARATLPLQRKVSMTLFLVIAVFIAFSFVIFRVVITPAFDELELSAAKTDLVRAEQAILSDIENLEAITADWAPWDEFYEYVLGRYPEFRVSNLFRLTLTNLGLDMIAVYKADRELDWAYLLVGDEDRDFSELQFLHPDNPDSRKLTSHDSIDSKIAGVVGTVLGPMLITSRPILRSDETGPMAGTLIMGQFLNTARLVRRTEVQMHLLSIEELNRSAEPEMVQSILQGKVSHSLNDGTVSSFTMLPDIYGEHPLLLRTDTPRDISSLGSKTTNAGLLFFGVAALMMTAVVWYLLRGAILRPIEMLAKHIDRIRKSGDLTKKLELFRDDEIGALASQFDNLTSEVHEARQALLDQSFKAGKADTAAEVLHNIRNTMTPMINGIERLAKSFTVAGSVRVAEVTAQLADPDCPPERAAKLLQYIDASFKRMEEVGMDAADDLKIVTSQARQVEAILADQEKFANVAPVAENIAVNDVLGEAAHVIPKDAVPEVNVKMAGGLGGFRVRAHRIGLLQVMGNLILNAYESIQRNNKADGQICLSASGDTLDEKPMVRLTIRDNGGGFGDDICKQIFERGFTSKAKGDANGLGLHWCANAVASMGGRISAVSAGQGEGAEFHVLLPAAQGG